MRAPCENLLQLLDAELTALSPSHIPRFGFCLLCRSSSLHHQPPRDLRPFRGAGAMSKFTKADQDALVELCKKPYAIHSVLR
jgi:hypothetical protein